jgi:hypothetical protein
MLWKNVIGLSRLSREGKRQQISTSFLSWLGCEWAMSLRTDRAFVAESTPREQRSIRLKKSFKCTSHKDGRVLP